VVSEPFVVKPGWLDLGKPPVCFSNVVVLGRIQAFWLNVLEDAPASISQHPGSWVCGSETLQKTPLNEPLAVTFSHPKPKLAPRLSGYVLKEKLTIALLLHRKVPSLLWLGVINCPNRCL
jgi:hypothetical protein